MDKTDYNQVPTPTREEIIRKLDTGGAICRDKLYPARLWALQLFTKKNIDQLINNIIIGPLAEICEHDIDKELFRIEFGKTELYIGEDEIKEIAKDYVTQFIKDFKVFGLREAVVYLHAAKFIKNPNKVIEDAINLVVEITDLYLKNKKDLYKSKEDKIKNLLLAVKLRES
jgi:hypothetical protein